MRTATTPAPNTADRKLEKGVRTALAYIRDHPDGKLSLANLAKRAGCTKHAFHRAFKGLIGTNLHQHVRMLRLSQAATRLATSRDSVLSIALDAGFGSHASFTRAFRAQHGLAPITYRAQRSSSERGSVKTHQAGCAYTVSLIKIPVRDFASARKFYRDDLGLVEECAVEAYGWAGYRLGNLPLGVYVIGKGGGNGTPGEELGFHLSVADAPALYRQLRARGVAFACELTTSDDGGSFFMPKDPDGNTFKVVQAQ